jgi:hypothetical protein
LLLIQFPLLLIVIAALAQALSMALSHVPLRRNRIDELALAVVDDPTNYPIVLFGDSITRNATTRYAVDPAPGEVANIATQAYAGLQSGLFLLERYLESHKPPQYFVITASPEDYFQVPDHKMVHYYDWNVFSRPSEREFLKSYMPDIDAQDRYPAVLNLQENILERLIGLLKGSPPHLESGARAPDPNPVLEPRSENLSNPATLAIRFAHTLELAPMQEAVLTRICALSEQYGFHVAIVWPPAPPELLEIWRNSGQLPALEKRIYAITGKNCNFVGPIVNLNDSRTYTNFDLRSYHLRGPGWEQRFALDLRNYLASLPGVIKSASAASP